MENRPRPPSPSMWYNANGYEWGQIGPSGELLDPNGNALPEPKHRVLPVFFGLLVLAIMSIVILAAWWNGSFDSHLPASVPTTYSAPCGGK